MEGGMWCRMGSWGKGVGDHRVKGAQGSGAAKGGTVQGGA